MKKYNLAVVGATGMVGSKFLEVLAERNLPVENYYLFASAKSAGREIEFLGKKHVVIELNDENIKKYKVDIAIFSAGGSISKLFAPIFVKNGAIVVDNSSYWRMDKDVPLVVPEVNKADIFKHKGIISNPNCSTIQAMLPIKALHDKYTIKRIVFSTYQAVSGAGVKGWNDLQNGVCGEAPQNFAYPIFNNLIPQIDVFLESGYTKEEQKMIDETKKILNDDSIKVTATCIRVPIFNSHSESINLEFEKPVTKEGIIETLKSFSGIVVQDDTSKNIYPMPLYSTGHDEVFVGRVRIDNTVESGCNIWCCADNIRKGAATNTVQIAEILLKEGNL